MSKRSGSWYERARHKVTGIVEDHTIDDVVSNATYLLLNHLYATGIKPDRIVRTAENLIAIWVSADTKRIRIAVCEDAQYVCSIPKESKHYEKGTAREVIIFLIGFIK